MSGARRNSPKRTKHVSADQLRAILAKKKACNVKALAIVEQMLCQNVKEEDFMEMLHDINQNHMQDIFVERSIMSLCGYALCSNKLTTVLKQQYKIDLANGRVYDISERKMFCSSNCYRSAIYIKEQMLESPLWMRLDADKPDFKLLSIDKESD